jgi:hypothetical protein
MGLPREHGQAARIMQDQKKKAVVSGHRFPLERQTTDDLYLPSTTNQPLLVN